ncbi:MULTISPECIES: MarR family transcriptional regulator [unclassified Streptomyces]|uniref:MarR family winged helix-turn-helix transcriptional regulator n=1 Tax=unclassified Streptomyces TaxID=2593676 RepID=UPI002DDC550E|nr:MULTISPECIES: MarR family transcriptional regulator [unclassified Streptomyces]WSE01148.1 MarR family transcriptional regulator [Streptomyces sp. NBC_01474]
MTKRSRSTRSPGLRPDERRLAVWTDFLVGHSRIMAALEQELREAHAMSLAEYDVLHHLAQARGRRLRMRELSQAVLYTTSGITRLLDRMVEAGLVEREPSPSDRRVMYAVLTRQGLALLRKASATHLAGVQRHFGSHVMDEELDDVERFMARLTSSGPDGAADS